MALAGRLNEKEVLDAAELKEVVESITSRPAIIPVAMDNPNHFVAEATVTH